MSEPESEQRAAPPNAAPESNAAPAPAPAPDAAVCRNWRKAFFRLWSLRTAGTICSTRSSAATLILGVASVALWVAIDRWESRPDPEFVADNVPLFAWYAVGVLMLAAALRRQSRPTPAYGDALALVTGLVPMLVVLATILAGQFDGVSPRDISFICGLYSLPYLARGMRAITGQSQRLASCAGALFIMGFVWLSN